MRDIRYIAIHCTAGQPTQTTKSILDYWKNKSSILNGEF